MIKLWVDPSDRERALHLEKQFDVEKPRDAAARAVSQDDTLLSLFPNAEVEIVARNGNQRTNAL